MLDTIIQQTAGLPKLLVIGIGGSGNNALDRMQPDTERNVEYLAINTDIQVLNACLAPQHLQIGKKLTSGFGAGADPSIGEAAAFENEEEIAASVEGFCAVILTCGMGGGTGTGAIPVIAKICRQKGILTIAVITRPFSFEGAQRNRAALEGIVRLQEQVDTLLVIPNDRLLVMSEKKFFLEDAFQMADTVLKYTIDGITNIIYHKGMINLDFNDLQTILKDKGYGHLGIGVANDPETLLDAVQAAIHSPLLETQITGASHIMLNTSGRVDLLELNEAIAYIQEQVAPDVNLIWGTVSDPMQEDDIVVTLIATGLKHTPADMGYLPIAEDTCQDAVQIYTTPLPPPGMPRPSKPKDIVLPVFLQQKMGS